MPSVPTQPPAAPSLSASPSYYVAIEGKTYGPYTTAQLTEMAAKGTITPETPCCVAGADKWTIAAAVPGMPFPAGFEHATAVFRFKEEGFAISRRDLLQGLDDESARHLAHLGLAGWELVSAVPFSSGGASLSFTGSANKTDAVLAFFKRPFSTASKQKVRDEVRQGEIYYSEGWWRMDGSKRYGPYATREEAERTPPPA